MKESELIDKFEKHFLKCYANADFKKDIGTAYTKQGQPDLMLKYSGDARAYPVEVKRATSGEAAIHDLRPTQRGRHKELIMAGYIVLILFDGGCIRVTIVDGKTVYQIREDDILPFSAIDKFLMENKINDKN